MSTRELPNVVLIMVDQMVASAIGAHGHPVVKTPNIDRLVQTGVTFRNCYCNSPLCVPARAAFMTSRLASTIDVYDNGSELKSTLPTFAHEMKRLGYECALSGKMHFIGPDQLHGFDSRLTEDFHTHTPRLTPDWSRGTYHNHGTGVRRITGTTGTCRWNRQLTFDERVLFESLAFLRSRRPDQTKNKPFFLCSSFIHPHDPFEVPERYLERFRNSDIPLPQTRAPGWEDMHPFDRWIQTHHELDDTTLSDDDIVANRRAYYGMISYIDEKVGAIVSELGQMQLAEDTMVIFAGDHGEMLGEHGMWFKRTYFEEAVKVPLVMSWPGKLHENRREDSIVSLIDIGPTLIELLSPNPEEHDWLREVDGKSFASMLTGARSPESDSETRTALFEYGGEGPIEPMVGVRKNNYKYVRVREHSPLLFDLSKDPNEQTNLAGMPEHLDTETALGEILDQHFNLDSLKQRITTSQRERLGILTTERDYVPLPTSSIGRRMS